VVLQTYISIITPTLIVHIIFNPFPNPEHHIKQRKILQASVEKYNALSFPTKQFYQGLPSLHPS
jgi:hypothetical protein